jgi:excisionase family DNA binding protein
MSDAVLNDEQLLLVTPEEAARRLAIGRTTVYELLSSGALGSVQIGRSRRVPVSALSAFVERLADQAAERSTRASSGLSACPPGSASTRPVASSVLAMPSELRAPCDGGAGRYGDHRASSRSRGASPFAG